MNYLFSDGAIMQDSIRAIVHLICALGGCPSNWPALASLSQVSTGSSGPDSKRQIVSVCSGPSPAHAKLDPIAPLPLGVVHGGIGLHQNAFLAGATLKN
jgi:hypothetical protein